MHTTSCITVIVTEHVYINKPASFFPRPSHRRLFTVYKNGERSGQLYRVNDVNVYLGSRGEEVFLTELEAFSCSVVPNTQKTYHSLFDEEHMDEKCTLLTRDSFPSPLS